MSGLADLKKVDNHVMRASVPIPGPQQKAKEIVGKAGSAVATGLKDFGLHTTHVADIACPPFGTDPVFTIMNFLDLNFICYMLREAKFKITGSFNNSLFWVVVNDTSYKNNTRSYN